MSDTFVAYILLHCCYIVNEKSVLNIKKSVLDIDEQSNGRYNNYVENKFSWEEIMLKTKRRIAIMSLLVCLMASFTLAFGFGSTSKANADGETTYKLSFLGEPTNLITTDGWSGDAVPTLSDGVLEFAFSATNNSVYYAYNTTEGTTYSIKFTAQAVGSAGGMSIHLFTADWNLIKDWEWVTESSKTYSYEWTATADSALFAFQYAGSDSTVQFRNFTIAEKLADDITVTAGAAIANLPAVPEKAGFVGHWEIDGKAISSETVYDFGADKTAVPVYEKAYTLTFFGEPTNISASVEGWSAGVKTDDGIKMTLTGSTNYCNTSVFKFVEGSSYVISYEDRYVGGEKNWAAYHLWEGNTWARISVDITAVGTWTAHSFTYTPSSVDSNTIWFQYRDGNSEVEFKNFTITEVIETKVFTKAGVIGELPAVPEKAGYIGHWEMDGETITAETDFAATENKVATVVYEKAYALTYVAVPETNMIKDGWSVENKIENDVLTVNLTAETRTPSITLFAGVTYRITFDYQKVAGDIGYATFHLFDGNWKGIKTAIAATDTKQTLEIEYTPTKASSDLIFQWAEGDKGVKLSNFTVYGYAKVQTLKAGEAVGTVPSIACGTNYRAYWKIGDVEVTADTTISQDEIANLVIEYNGHVFKGSEFAFVEAKNTTKPGENTATYAIKYVGTEAVESWSGRNAEDWSDGQFANQIITLNVKKADGTEATIVSNQMQLHNGELWFSFTSKVFGDIAEVTIPAGEYKLTDGTGFKLEEITFYMVHYNCGLNEKTDYTVEHIAEVKETCTTDGCLDYYHCDKCGRYFEDEDCTTEIEDIDEWKADENGGLLERTGHDFKTEWSSDETEHWHECKDCGEKTDKAAHTDDNKDNKCDVCGVKCGKESGCASDLSTFTPYLAIMICAALCVIFLRKNKVSSK